MRKIILALCLCALCGCEAGAENARNISSESLFYTCINGHLYIVNSVYGGGVYTPLFAADSDVPMLVKCPKSVEEKQCESN